MSKPTLVPYERLASRPQHRQARERALASCRAALAAQARSLVRLMAGCNRVPVAHLTGAPEGAEGSE